MTNNFGCVIGYLPSLNIDELDKVIGAAQKQKEKIKLEAKCAAAANLVEAFKAYKKATGEDSVVIQNCFKHYSNDDDACIRIDNIYLDSYGNISQEVIY